MERRNGERQPTSEKCILNHGGRRFDCRVEDVSISGLRIRLNDISALVGFTPGDLCTIDFSDNPEISRREVRCSVSRRTGEYLALELAA